jgi:hypothetical protein
MKATILEEQYVFINTCAAANNWAGSIINSNLLVNSPKEVLVGLDAEWNKGDTGIHLLQLSCLIIWLQFLIYNKWRYTMNQDDRFRTC